MLRRVLLLLILLPIAELFALLWVYRELARWSMGLAERDYPSTGREGCAEYPADAFPWE